jgi:hypothetical protein
MPTGGASGIQGDSAADGGEKAQLPLRMQAASVMEYPQASPAPPPQSLLSMEDWVQQ